MTVPSTITHILKRDGTVVTFDRARISHAILKATLSVGAANPGLAGDMAERVEYALIETYGNDAFPSVEDIQDVVERVLMVHHHTRIARNYIIYRNQRAMARAARAIEFEVTDNVPYRKLYEVLRWNMEHDCESVPKLNRLIDEGLYPELVRAVDARYSLEVLSAATTILERGDAVRIVIVAGPSSSGKTTTMIRVSEQLARAGRGFKSINIDHYFFDLDQHPIDEFGDHDYERPEALDLALINEHLVQLLAGQTIRTPHYDFKTGLRTLNVHALTLDPNEILLIDSLHGLHDEMTASVPAVNKFSLYVETLGQLKSEDGTFMRWADNRLLRRMSRDKDHRNMQPMETLTHWHYVRRSELKYIIPYLKGADFIVNSALPYELPILKHRLFHYVAPSINRYGEDPRRLDAHIRANRVYALLNPLREIRDDACVPADSLLREFIGGSAYTY